MLGRLRGGSPGRSGYKSRDQVANQGLARRARGGARSLQTPSVPTPAAWDPRLRTPGSRGLCSLFKMLERTLTWELARGGHVGVCRLWLANSFLDYLPASIYNF